MIYSMPLIGLRAVENTSRREGILKALVWETQVKNRTMCSLKNGAVLPAFKGWQSRGQTRVSRQRLVRLAQQEWA